MPRRYSASPLLPDEPLPDDPLPDDPLPDDPLPETAVVPSPGVIGVIASVRPFQ